LGRQAIASAAGLVQIKSKLKGNGFVMHNLPSLTASVPSNTSVERTAQSCALGALRGYAAPASSHLRRCTSPVLSLQGAGQD